MVEFIARTIERGTKSGHTLRQSTCLVLLFPYAANRARTSRQRRLLYVKKRLDCREQIVMVVCGIGHVAIQYVVAPKDCIDTVLVRGVRVVILVEGYDDDEILDEF